MLKILMTFVESTFGKLKVVFCLSVIPRKLEIYFLFQNFCIYTGTYLIQPYTLYAKNNCLGNKKVNVIHSFEHEHKNMLQSAL